MSTVSIWAPSPARQSHFAVVSSSASLHRVDREGERQFGREPGEQRLREGRERFERTALGVEALVQLARPVAGFAERRDQVLELRQPRAS